MEPVATTETGKVAVIGAGSVGATLAYTLAAQQIARKIAVYDIHETKVEAEILDLQHGTQFTPGVTITGGADVSTVAGSQVVAIAAGAKQKPGQTRLELAATNVEILRNLLPELLNQAPDAIYLLVTNPCDVMTFAAQRLSKLPTGRIFGSGTVLDTSRLRQVLADRAGVVTSSVHADIIGEHGDSEFAVWSQARIGPIPILDWQTENSNPFTLRELEDITDRVRRAAYQVIEGKGATNYAIGLSAARIIKAIVANQHAVLPVSTVHSNYRGISDVAFSVPSIVSSDGVSQVLNVPLSGSEERELRASAQAVSDSIAELDLD